MNVEATGRDWNFGRNLFVAGAIVVLPFAALIWLRLGFTWPCPLRWISGLPCAACGGIRSLAALAQLDVMAALRWNPLIAVLVVSLPILLLFRRRLILRPAAIWLAVGANWAYLLFCLPK